MPPIEATPRRATAYSGRFGLEIANTSPLAHPRRASPAAVFLTAPASCAYVSVRPVGPSISAGLSPRRAAWRRTYSVIDTSGMSTAGLVLLTIIAVLPRRQCGRRYVLGIGRTRP